MSLRSTAGRLGAAALVALAVVAVVGTLLGQPILLGFVESGSMEPALSAGDGFVSIPAAVAGPVEPGAVVVFDAERIGGGGPVVHEVVGETERGYVTQGAANPFTDQSIGEPPVKDAQVVAVVPRVGGSPVAIPYLGTVVDFVGTPVETAQNWLATTLGVNALRGTQGLATLVFAVCVVAYALEVRRERGGRTTSRRSTRETGFDVRLAYAAFALVLVVAATLAMVGPAGVERHEVVSAEFDSPGPRVVPAGETETATQPVGNGGVLPVVAYLEPASEGVAVEPGSVALGPGEVHNATVALSAPPETGFYRRYVVQHRYLAILPKPVLDGLHSVHPWLPIAVIDALVAGSYYALCSLFIGTGRVRNRDRERPRRATVVRMISRRFG